ncbi:two-component system response regulator [Methanospirillum stamsii]|uniref:Two-component system response regulator n=1 Tax=Methanospirillum stamsii TaxID=1277351 RepID=A0A2V2MWR1_9EURY|nr:two-component system response regulator [Methanospirillum stamsii]
MVQKILIVDDTIKDLQSGSQLLTRSGFQVYTARNGEDALSLLEKKIPDIILLDLIMPGMDGIEVMRIIREKYPEIPVVLCTAADQEPIVRLAMLSGAFGVIVKPYDPDTMLRTIRRSLGEEG